MVLMQYEFSLNPTLFFIILEDFLSWAVEPVLFISVGTVCQAVLR